MPRATDYNPSKILDHLYQGGSHRIKRESCFTSLGITHVVSVCIEAPPPKLVDKLSLQTLHYPKEDASGTNLSEHFEETTRFIHEARENGGVVLIHCSAGVSRSSTITLAYLMSWLSISYGNAFRFLSIRRPIVTPNAGFIHQLKEFEKTPKFSSLNSEMRSGSGWEERILNDYQMVINTAEEEHQSIVGDPEAAHANEHTAWRNLLSPIDPDGEPASVEQQKAEVLDLIRAINKKKEELTAPASGDGETPSRKSKRRTCIVL